MAWNCDTCVYRKTVELNDLALDCCSNPTADRYFGMMRDCPEYKQKMVKKEKLISLDKACEWLEDKLRMYAGYSDTADLVDSFRKAMEE
jgi:hypothetical protein